MAANSEKTAKKRGKPWVKGQSGNPAGRPRDGESWAAVIASVGNMYPDDLLQFIGKDNDLGQMLATLPKNVQLKYLVTARVFASLMFEPTSGLWKELMERAEGKVSQPISGDPEAPMKVVIEYVNQSTVTDAAQRTDANQAGTEEA